MTNNPNIKKEIVQYVIENYDDCPVSIVDFANTTNYDNGRVVRKASEITELEWGTSPRYVWPKCHDTEQLREKLTEWE